jgi:hypothetical protein
MKNPFFETASSRASVAFTIPLIKSLAAFLTPHGQFGFTEHCKKKASEKI